MLVKGSDFVKDFFISYNKHDRTWAEWVAWVLEDAGYETVIQAWDFRPGGNFAVDMQNAATGTKQTIAVLSSHYLKSDFPLAEWTEAFARDPSGIKRTLLPVRVSPCRVDGLLANRTYVDLVGLAEDAAVSELLSAFKHRGKPDTPPKFPGNNAMPERKCEYPGRASNEVDVWAEKLDFLNSQLKVVDNSEDASVTRGRIETVRRELIRLQTEASKQTSTQRASGIEPSVQIANDRDQQVVADLNHALARKRRLQSHDADTTVVDAEILNLKRDLRRGGVLKSGDRLGDDRYVLERILGEGGFSTVWRAIDVRDGVRVAIKVLQPTLARHQVSLERFFRGARIMREIGCGGVVPVISERCEDDGYYFFVMELVEGGSLQDAVLGGKIGPDRAVQVMIDILEVLDIAHSHREECVHRDIKPSNVLLTLDGAVKLTDFDLVTVNDTTGGTQTGMLGTFMFAAPEQCSEASNVDCRADLFSVAMTGLFVLHGNPLPYTVIRNTEKFVSQLPIQSALYDVLMQALELDREDRFQTAEEFRNALRETQTSSNRPAPQVRKRRKKTATAAKRRYAVPSVRSKTKVEQALREFDQNMRSTRSFINFLNNRNYKYAIHFEGRYYPVKKVIELVTGMPRSKFSQGPEARERLTSLGFEVMELHRDSETTSADENSSLNTAAADLL
jgi:serine/threonine protein kinase